MVKPTTGAGLKVGVGTTALHARTLTDTVETVERIIIVNYMVQVTIGAIWSPVAGTTVGKCSITSK